MREIEAMKELREIGEVFTSREAIQRLGMEKGAFYYHMRRLREDGFIKRLGRGRYALTLSREKEAIDPFILSSIMIMDCAVGYWSALNYYGLTEQMPRIIYVLTPTRGDYKQLIKVRGIRAVIVGRKKFFGFEEIWISGRTVRITNPEKTVADCLDKPKHCGGITEVVKAMKAGVDTDVVREYVRRMGSGAALKRLAYLTEALGIEFDGKKRILKEIKGIKGYPSLDPTHERKGKWSSRWGLLLNVSEKYLEGEM